MIDNEYGKDKRSPKKISPIIIAYAIAGIFGIIATWMSLSRPQEFIIHVPNGVAMTVPSNEVEGVIETRFTEMFDTIQQNETEIARLEEHNRSLLDELNELQDSLSISTQPPPREILLFTTPYVDVRDVIGFSIVQGSTERNNGIQLSTGRNCDANHVAYALNGNALTFTATLNAARGASIFRVYGDERLLYESPPLASTAPPIPIEIDVTGVHLLRLEVEFIQNHTFAIFENATILTTG